MPASSAWSGSTGSSVSGSASSSTVGRCTATRGASASRSKPNSAAGINPAAMKVADMTLGLWRKVFNVNLEGPLRMSQCVAPVMRDNGGGSIVHIGTMGAYHAGSDTVAYGASKAALKNLTVTMAVDWAPWKVRVNLLSPGPFMSEMVRGADRAAPGFVDMLASANAMKRIAEPDEIVGPVLYLASDASSYVTGDDITVSGGMRK